MRKTRNIRNIIITILVLAIIGSIAYYWISQAPKRALEKQIIAMQGMHINLGIYGGRFSGAGFKGACIALVDPAKEKSICESVTEEYLKLYPQYKDSFEIFFCNPANGVDFL